MPTSPGWAIFLARDKFLPHQFAFRGDRLAFSFGIITLGVLAGLLIIIFGGQTEALLPLYAIGVFTSFTLSQSGMVVRWWRMRPPGWQFSLAVNAVGATTTALVTLILAFSNFTRGAWMVLIIVPVLVLMFLRIHKHYTNVSSQISLAGVDPILGRAAEKGEMMPVGPGGDPAERADRRRHPSGAGRNPAAYRAPGDYPDLGGEPGDAADHRLCPLDHQERGRRPCRQR